MVSKLQTTAAVAGTDTFWQKSITRKTLITRKVLKA